MKKHKKNNIKKKKTKKTRNRKIKKSKHNNDCLFYFSMKGCPYCDNFKPLWTETKKKYPNVNMFNIKREQEPILMKQLNIKSYPTLLIMKGDNLIHYQYDRTPKLIDLFLKENKLI